jgi:beta-N-acetylglucosaminidase
VPNKKVETMQKRRIAEGLKDKPKAFYNESTFKALQKQWYKKLKATEFKEAESGNDMQFLITYHSTKLSSESFYDRKSGNPVLSKHSLIFQEAARNYYREAEHFLNTHKFFNERNKTIWQLHAEGLSYNTISKKINLSIKKTRFIIESIRKLVLNQVSEERKLSLRKYT